jgi:subtilisin family serine protease
MTDFLPAWSEPFHRDQLPAAPPLDLSATITPSWAYGDGSGAGVRVAVVDSGVDADHPLVRGVSRAIEVQRDRTSEDGVRFVEGPHDDLYGHGTACAGIIRELAPAAELVSVRVLGSNLKGSGVLFAHGLDWCIENGVHVVSLSLSTGNEALAQTFWDLVDRATYRRVILVSALNNERKRSIPSEYAGVFSVACAPGRDRERFWYNPDAPAEWGASGIDVEVGWSGGGTITASGNSFAAPVIAGHLARIIGAHPGIAPWQARTILAALAENTPACTVGQPPA